MNAADHTVSTLALKHAVRDGIARSAAVIGLGGIALIHLLDLPGHFGETTYLAWMYIALIAGAVAVAAALVHGSDSRAWAAAGGLALSVIAGYVVSRTIGLPNSADDIGNWLEPLGLASLFVEAGVVGVSGLVLLERARATDSAPVLAAYARA